MQGSRAVWAGEQSIYAEMASCSCSAVTREKRTCTTALQSYVLSRDCTPCQLRIHIVVRLSMRGRSDLCLDPLPSELSAKRRQRGEGAELRSSRAVSARTGRICAHVPAASGIWLL